MLFFKLAVYTYPNKCCLNEFYGYLKLKENRLWLNTKSLNKKHYLAIEFLSKIMTFDAVK